MPLPPSAVALLSVLAAGPKTHAELLLLTGLPPRTVRYGLHRLRERGLVTVRGSLRDARQRLHFAVPAFRNNTVI